MYESPWDVRSIYTEMFECDGCGELTEAPADAALVLCRKCREVKDEPAHN